MIPDASTEKASSEISSQAPPDPSPAIEDNAALVREHDGRPISLVRPTAKGECTPDCFLAWGIESPAGKLNFCSFQFIFSGWKQVKLLREMTPRGHHISEPAIKSLKPTHPINRYGSL
jgi:hypothetical protein